VEKHQIMLDIAAYGWQSESWQGFYPADLPDDWRLDFYSNEFRSIVVPAEIWQGITPDMVSDWHDAVHNQFRFYFDVSPEQLPSKEQRLVMAALKSRRGGWVCQPPASVDKMVPSIWYAGPAEPRLMREAIEQLHQSLGEANRGLIVVNSIINPWDVAADMRQLAELMGYS
jgi:uncharacterized protein YecE (DUF72 family)